MKQIFFIVFLCLILPEEVYSECKKTGSSFSRKNQNCDDNYEDNAVTYNQNYINNYYYYDSPRPYRRYYPQAYDYRQDRAEDARARIKNYPNNILDRGYAPGFGTSHPMPR